MHAAGAAHRDLKAANLLVVEERGDVIVYLVDLDGLQPGGQVGFQRQARDLARLGGGTGRASLGHAVDLPAFSPRLPASNCPQAADRLEAAVAGNRRAKPQGSSAASRSAVGEDQVL